MVTLCPLSNRLLYQTHSFPVSGLPLLWHHSTPAGPGSFSFYIHPRLIPSGAYYAISLSPAVKIDPLCIFQGPAMFTFGRYLHLFVVQ